VTDLTRVCTQTNIPTVDNSTPQCKDVVYEQCVIMTKDRSNPITIEINDTLEEVIDALLQKVADLEARIQVLENYNVTNP
jgi:hypothetical protein